MSLMAVKDVVVRFGGITALDGISFDVDESQVCGLIGPNGAGKTTLFNALSRLVQPAEGSITFDGVDLLAVPPKDIAGLGLGRTFQNLGLFANMTVAENVMLGAHHRTRAGMVASLFWPGWVRREEDETASFAAEVIDYLDLTDVAGLPAQALPFGTLKRVEIARALAVKPAMLLLDEPASGLSSGEVEDLAQLVGSIRDDFDLTVLLVEHHMGFVMSISEKVICLNQGEKLAEGTPREVQENPAVIEAYLGVSS